MKSKKGNTDCFTVVCLLLFLLIFLFVYYCFDVVVVAVVAVIFPHFEKEKNTCRPKMSNIFKRFVAVTFKIMIFTPKPI